MLVFLSMSVWWILMLTFYLLPSIIDSDYNFIEGDNDFFAGVLLGAVIFFLYLDLRLLYKEYRKWITVKREGFKGLWKDDYG